MPPLLEFLPIQLMLPFKKGIQGVLGGRLSFRLATLEAFRRGRAKVSSQRERALLDELNAQVARLTPDYQSLSSTKLLQHFRTRSTPRFLPGFEKTPEVSPTQTARLIESARQIVKHRWSLLGFGELEFGPTINWHRDPLSGRAWPLDYHTDIPLWHNDGSDIRVLWELNRLAHFLTLAQAYALTSDEEFAREFFVQLESWREQNPVGRGANWSCAMEVALRAMNLLAAFSLIRSSPELTEERLLSLLALFDQHAEHIRRNLEFSYVVTSNHYLSDVAGLLWIAVMLPELTAAGEWRGWALKELLHEMEKQILADGAGYEGSTGYHCFVFELFLYSFMLCRANKIEIADHYLQRLRAMCVYLRNIVRPDGTLPLIGDTDGGRVLPLGERDANDRSYLLSLGAVVFADAPFKLAALETPPEVSWILGDEGVRTYEQLATENNDTASQAFPAAGSYVMRHEDLFLLLNANGANNDRPASHRHNDILSIEVSAGGRPFIVDPGTYVYTADLHERHLFRSTSYHSTIQIDGEEQEAISEVEPFVIGNGARVEVLLWKTDADVDRVTAEHSGYERLGTRVKHRRTVTLNKHDRYWLIEDELIGNGEHEIAARFHFDAGLAVHADENRAIAHDAATGMRLVICELGPAPIATLKLEPQFVSRHYGSKLPSMTACWSTRSRVSVTFRWAIVPVGAYEDLETRLRVAQEFG